jgi:copper(I)-binding protein
VRLAVPILLVLLATAHAGADGQVGELEIERPWARATPTSARNGVAYMTIRNRGSETDRLVSVETPVAESATVHETVKHEGMMTMRTVARLAIGPGQSAVLEPGGLHIMLMGLRAPLEKGQTFALTLRFERAGAIEVELKAAAIGASSPE